MIHGHEVLRMMEGNSYTSAAELIAARFARISEGLEDGRYAENVAYG